MFEARVEGSQPRFCSERFPGCMVETGAFMFSLSLCIFVLCLSVDRLPSPGSLYQFRMDWSVFRGRFVNISMGSIEGGALI